MDEIVELPIRIRAFMANFKQYSINYKKFSISFKNSSKSILNIEKFVYLPGQELWANSYKTHVCIYRAKKVAQLYSHAQWGSYATKQVLSKHASLKCSQYQMVYFSVLTFWLQVAKECI